MAEDVARPEIGDAYDSAATSEASGGRRRRAAAPPGALDCTLPATPPADAAMERGAQLDRYVILDRVGSGAMGEVYAAYDPKLDRKVALKRVRMPRSGSGRDGHRPGGANRMARARRRLMREAQALAQLSHPNVLAVHDVGTFRGELFMAMEYVEGADLGQWLAAQPRSLGEILDVFAAAGRGLVAAHCAGLIHRDFKPENVLVGADGRVRVADFGLARASVMDEPTQATEPTPSDPLTDTAVDSGPLLGQPMTHTAALLGTPLYMAPEQHAACSVGPPADQFAFCVALHFALYGVHPFAGQTLAELRAAVFSGDRVEVKATRLDVPARVRRALDRGLAADPDDRYSSMAALLAALSPPARPRGWSLLIGAAIVLCAMAGLGGALVVPQWRERSSSICTGSPSAIEPAWGAERREAVRAAFLASGRADAGATFERVDGLLRSYADRWSEMHAASCRATRVSQTQSPEVDTLRSECLRRRVVELGALTAIFAEGSDPGVIDQAVQASVWLTPVAACADIDALTARVPPPEEPVLRAKVDAVRDELAVLVAMMRAGQYAGALPKAADLAKRTAALGHEPASAEVLVLLGKLQQRAGAYADSRRTLEAAIATASRARHDEAVAQGWIQLLFLVGDQQARPDETTAWLLPAQSAVERTGDAQLRADLENVLGVLYGRQAKYSEALEHHQRALELFQSAFGVDHPSVAMSLANMGTILYAQGRYEPAIEHTRRALAIDRAAVGPQHPHVATSLANLASIFYAKGRYAEALEQLQEALGIRRAALGADHPHVAATLDNIGAVFRALGRHDDAAGSYQSARGIWESTLGPDDPAVAKSLHNLGLTRVAQHQYLEAQAAFQRALSIREAALGLGHPEVADSLTGLGRALVGLGRPGRAVAPLERALAIRLGGDAPPALRAETRFVLARALWVAKQSRARARELAAAAEAEFEAAGVGAAEQRAAVRAWRARHNR